MRLLSVLGLLGSGPDGPMAALERQRRRILDALAEGGLGLDPQGRITFSNPAASAILQWGARDLLGAPFAHLALGTPQGRPGAEALRETLEDGRTGEATVHLRRRDGTLLQAELVVSALRVAGRTEGAVAVLRDISERQEAETRLRQVLEAAPDAMLVVDGEGRICHANRQAESLFGHAREDLLHRCVDDLVPAARRSAHAAHRAAYAKAPRMRPMGADLELLAVRSDGTEFPVEISLSPLATPEGPMTIAAVRDVTNRRLLQERLRRSELHLREAQRLAGVGSWEWDVATDEVTWSDTLYALYGLEPGTPIDLATYLGLIHPDDRGLVEAVVQQAMVDGLDFAFLHRLVRPDGEVRVLLGKGRVEHGNGVLRMHGTGLDVTEMHEGREILAGRKAPCRWPEA